jgi:ankyrin repeat protein
MPASLPERGSRITIIVALSLTLVIVGIVIIPSLFKTIARQEEESRIRAALNAIHRDDPDALRSVLPRLKPETMRWGRVKKIASRDLPFVAVHDKAAVLSQLMESEAHSDEQEDSGIPLFLAAFAGRPRVIQFLVRQGADLNRRHPADGATALFSAVRSQYPAIAQILLEGGADPNIPLSELPYRRKLHIGPLPGPPPRSIKDYEEREEILNNEIRGKNEGGTTPLMCAAYSGSEAMVRLLLKHGADPSRKTKSGKSAIDFARQFKQAHIVRILGGASSGPVR